MGVETAVKDAASAAVEPVKKVVKGKGLAGKVGAAVGLLLLIALAFRFRTQIAGFIGKIPIIGNLFNKLAGLA